MSERTTFVLKSSEGRSLTQKSSRIACSQASLNDSDEFLTAQNEENEEFMYDQERESNQLFRDTNRITKFYSIRAPGESESSSERPLSLKRQKTAPSIVH
jgi:hypothetical protein